MDEWIKKADTLLEALANCLYVFSDVFHPVHLAVILQINYAVGKQRCFYMASPTGIEHVSHFGGPVRPFWPCRP